MSNQFICHGPHSIVNALIFIRYSVYQILLPIVMNCKGNIFFFIWRSKAYRLFLSLYSPEPSYICYTCSSLKLTIFRQLPCKRFVRLDSLGYNIIIKIFFKNYVILLPQNESEKTSKDFSSAFKKIQIYGAAE